MIRELPLPDDVIDLPPDADVLVTFDARVTIACKRLELGGGLAKFVREMADMAQFAMDDSTVEWDNPHCEEDR